MVFECLITCFTWLTVAVITVLLSFQLEFVRTCGRNLLRRFLAWDTNRLANNKVVNSGIFEMKKDLFSSMHEVIKTIEGPVLELGAGSGSSLQFYPNGTKLITIDLNENFKPYLLDNMQKYQNVTLQKFIVGNAEDMKKDIADNLCSCVVSSLLLCSVDQQKVLAEVMRILKPGGRFYFIEHLVAEPGTFVHWFQGFIESFWVSFRGGCHLMRKTNEVIEKFGFDDLSGKIIYRPLPWMYFFAKRTYVGSASKPLQN